MIPAGAVKEIPSVTGKSGTYKKRCHVPGDSGAMLWINKKKRLITRLKYTPWLNDDDEEGDIPYTPLL